MEFTNFFSHILPGTQQTASVYICAISPAAASVGIPLSTSTLKVLIPKACLHFTNASVDDS